MATKQTQAQKEICIMTKFDKIAALACGLTVAVGAVGALVAVITGAYAN